MQSKRVQLASHVVRAMQELCSSLHMTGNQRPSAEARLGVQERGARVQLAEVAEQLQVARLQHEVQPQLIA